MTSNNLSKGIAEFVGTFFLTLTIFIAAVNGSADTFAPIAIGLTLMVMIYALGHVSGAHFNPAVSIGFSSKVTAAKTSCRPTSGHKSLRAFSLSLSVRNLFWTGPVLRRSPL